LNLKDGGAQCCGVGMDALSLKITAKERIRWMREKDSLEQWILPMALFL
jgi:hypothetical protein